MVRVGASVLALWVCLAACGGNDPPALFPPDPDAGDDEDASVVPEDAGVDGASGSGGTEDRCTDSLSGISCDVQELVSVLQGFCARFSTGDVKCWGAQTFFPPMVSNGGFVVRRTYPASLGEELPFVPLDGPAEHLIGDYEACVDHGDNRFNCGWVVGERIFDGTDPVRVGVGSTGFGVWFLLGGREQLKVRVESANSASTLRTPFIPVAVTGYPTTNAEAGTSCGLDGEGKVWCWGDNIGGSLGVEDTMPRTLDAAQPVPLEERVTQIATAQNAVCVLTEDGQVKCWGQSLVRVARQGMGEDVGGMPGSIARLQPEPIGEGRRALQLLMSETAQSVTTCVLRDDGSVVCWGYNGDGQTGVGLDKPWIESVGGEALVPVSLGNGRRALQIAGTYGATCALLDDHSVKCWGRAGQGTLADDSKGDIGDEGAEMGNALPRINFGILTRAEREGAPPVVSVVSPVPFDDPSTADVVRDSLTVTCMVSRGDNGDPIDTNRVTARIAGTSGTSIEAPAIAAGDGTFTATLTGIAALPTGRYSVSCVALDQAAEPRVGRASVVVLHDGGPSVRLVTPVPNAAVGQTQPTTLIVEASPAELWAGDTEAAVVDAQVTVAGVVVPLSPTGEPNRYTATVDWLSTEFITAPSGNTQLILEATNARGVVASVSSYLNVDAVGPTITVTSAHANGQLVRGTQVMTLRVTDTSAGVDPGGVTATIGADTFAFSAQSADAFRGVFDTLRYDRTVSQLTVTIRAFDRVGNETTTTRSLQIDNQPPVISLDPPPVREVNHTVGQDVCSAPFDPVGSDSASDGDILPEGAEFRARMDDETNGLEGLGVLTYLALIDGASARVMMNTDLARPILIDTNEDGVCDEVNDELNLAVRSLVPITPQGRSWYPPSPDMQQPGWATWCSAVGSTTEPTPLCGSTSPLTRVIRGRVLGRSEPAIYGLSPAIEDVSCVGDTWDWRLERPQGGPACVVVRAEDTLGNVGVSPPIRVCLQRSDQTGFDCAADTSWMNHDCLAGAYDGAQVTCSPPPDNDVPYVSWNDPR